MTKIQKVLRDIDNLRDFYRRTEAIRRKVKERRNTPSASKKAEQAE
jgi:hypothetical protein